jgi:hypothetical protein
VYGSSSWDEVMVIVGLWYRLCNWKGSPQVIEGLCLAAQKEGSSCQKTVACTAEGHAYSVPQLKLLAETHR